MGRFIVFDSKGIVHESDDYRDALEEFEETGEFEGDLIFAEVLGRRR